jgi:hypothetical protein
MENATLTQGNMQQVANTATSKLVAMITAQAG